MTQASFQDVFAGVEDISPSIAKHYLLSNFENNRDLSTQQVNEYAKEMKSGLFTISSDCIAFDTAGRLINGQHRLNAVVQSETTQPFIVVRNLPPEVAQLIDVGKKRTMAARITIGGTRMSEKQCSTLRNALVPYKDNCVGTILYAKKIHDPFIENTFRNHQLFLQHPSITKFERGCSTFWTAAALRIFAEMYYRVECGFQFKHSQDPFERASMWLDLVVHGFSDHFQVDPKTDNAAIRIRNIKEKSSQDSRGSRWSSKADLRLTLSAAWHFMMGNSMQTIRPHGDDPFLTLPLLPSTNSYFN